MTIPTTERTVKFTECYCNGRACEHSAVPGCPNKPVDGPFCGECLANIEAEES